MLKTKKYNFERNKYNGTTSEETNRGVSHVVVCDVLYEFVDSLQQIGLELGLNHDEIVQHHVLPQDNTENIYHLSVNVSQRLPLEVCVGPVSHFFPMGIPWEKVDMV